MGMGDDPDDFGQHGAQVTIALGGRSMQAFAATLLVARSDPRPGSQVLGRGEAAHIGADLGQDGGSGECDLCQ